MELLYLWVEKYNNIEKQGFNFSSKYKFEFDYDKKELKCEENPNCVEEGFFGDNITNITAIIGKNGSGKTTVLKILIDLLYNAKNGYGEDNEISQKYKFFILFKIDNEIKIYKSDEMEKISIIENKDKIDIENKYKIKIESKNNKIFEIEESTIMINKELIRESTIVLFDNFPFDEIEHRYESYEHNKEYLINLTTNYLVYNNRNKKNGELIKERKIEKLKEIKMFIGDEKRREINYLEKNREMLVKDFKMINSLIDKVGLKLNRGKNYLSIKEYERIEEYEREVKESLVINFATILLRNDDIRDRNIEFLELKKSDELCKKAEEITNNKDYTKILNYLKKINEIDDNLNPKIELGAFLNIIKEHEIFKEIAYLYEFEYYNKDGEKLYLSSGEKQQLRIYSRMYSMIDGDRIVEYERKKDITKENIIILLDEPDIYMHPEWQRKFLSMFIEFIKTTFKDKKVQIILTSHSPFVISDLPRENIIFLNNDDGMCKVVDSSEKKKTFGANIHTLLSDGFFMESTLGEFARSKISWVMEMLDKDIEMIRKEEKKIKEIIEMIGEPIIKTKLMKMLEDKLNISLITVGEIVEKSERKVKGMQARINEQDKMIKALDKQDKIIKELNERLKKLENNGDKK